MNMSIKEVLKKQGMNNTTKRYTKDKTIDSIKSIIK